MEPAYILTSLPEAQFPALTNFQVFGFETVLVCEQKSSSLTQPGTFFERPLFAANSFASFLGPASILKILTAVSVFSRTSQLDVAHTH